MSMIRSIKRNMMREALRAKGVKGVNRKRHFKGEESKRSVLSKAWNDCEAKANVAQHKERRKLFQRRKEQAKTRGKAI